MKGEEKMKSVGEIYSTDDYQVFSKLEGNRTVLEARKNIILKSIKERGWIRNPIVVNEKMEIIDGQGRFEALKELKMPIEYVISKNATIEDCIALNLKQKNWTNNDYISCYADMGNEDYIILKEISNIHKWADGTAAWAVALNSQGDCGGFDSLIKSGKAKIRDKKTLYERLNFVDEAMSLIGRENGRKRLWATVLTFVFYCEEIDNQKLLKNLKKYKPILIPATTLLQGILSLEKVYNYGIRNKVYFAAEYDKYKQIRKQEA